MERRTFIHKSVLTTSGFIAASGQLRSKNQGKTLFDISLAQWSLNRSLFAGKMDNLDFAPLARKHGITAIEYVNQFFMDKAEDQSYLLEMKTRADSEGVKSLLIMCDREGALGAVDDQERKRTVENHRKWLSAAKFLGCHSIRVNGYVTSPENEKPDYYESQKLVADGLHQLCEYAEEYNLNVIIENHGGHSSHAPWLMGVMRLADHHLVGTLPDFGNFRIQASGDGKKAVSYDSYRGIAEMMPLAKGVSVKPTVWDDHGNQSPLDYTKMMEIVLDAGFRGYCGIEHGEKDREWESIEEVSKQLVEAREQLKANY